MRRPSFLLLACVAAAQGATAQVATPTPRARDTVGAAHALDTIRVRGRVDDLIGVAASASEGRVGAADLRQRSTLREAELLETVPGLIVTQHSGAGKANQYFVRGFNLDHGTDFQTRLEGMPLNLPSHGHGQGYTDLNFLIPELIDYIDYKLGVHHAELGDFGSAGGAEFHLVSKVDRPLVGVQYGQHGLARLVGARSSRLAGGDVLVGGEGKVYDGPWQLSERLRKFSGVARYTRRSGAQDLAILALAYRNGWNANDQIPLRAVDGGIISRFGQLDSTDGGAAQRYSVSASLRRIGATSTQRAQLFAVYSDLSLFSNFTYFLDDPLRGDQFSQTDRRIVLGGAATHVQQMNGMGTDHTVTFGLETRADIINGVGLHRTERRVRHGTVREDDVRQSGSGVFVEAQSHWLPRLRTVLGVRADAYAFDVESDRAENSGRRGAAIVSPKGSIVFTPGENAELYLSGGFGFHSNDARGTTITIDPSSGEAASRVDPLVRSRGAELGMRLAPVEAVRTTVSIWALRLDSELLFVGDAGATEPSAASRRRGVTIANFFRPLPQLTIDADVSFARAELAGVPRAESRIPGALERVVASGVTWAPRGEGVFSSVRVRYFGAYPLTEDNGSRADGSMLVHADVGYRLRSGTRFHVSVLNVLNGRADDIQYAYASRLRGEGSDGVDDVHFHPAEPRQVRVSVEWRP